MIELKSISKRYGKKHAVKDFSLTVEKGEMCCLIGPSGCGKSTTLKMINRMIEPNAGEIILDGNTVTAMNPERLRRRIGYVIQSVGLFPHMSVAENVAVVPKLLKWDRARTQKRSKELLELLGLKPDVYFDKYPSQLSGGEAQRVGVARALAADPEVLLMDEPFGALDPITRDRLQSRFAKIHRRLNKTVVFVTHDMDEAVRLGSRIALMRAGELVAYDTPESLLSSRSDSFVKEFVGTDRALKKLSRLSVREHMKEAAAVPQDASAKYTAERFAAAGDDTCFFWVVDENDRFIGWVDREEDKADVPVAERIVRPDPEEYSLSIDADLKMALSLLLREGTVVVPVVDDELRILGEIRLCDLAAV